jgi:hypothetical protein
MGKNSELPRYWKRLMCILEGLDIQLPDAFEAFDEAVKPDDGFAAMLKDFQPEDLGKWTLTRLPENIGEDQQKKLQDCREFIKRKHPHLLQKMDAMCAVCQINKEQPSKRVRVK